MFDTKTLNELTEYINNTSDRSSIYLGCDSTVNFSDKNAKKPYATFTFVVIIHKDSCRGCKIFGDSFTKQLPGYQVTKPAQRLMEEVVTAVDVYNQIYPVIADREIEIHLDINPDERHASSGIIQQAMGYVKGVTQITPTVKPGAFAASCAADRFIGATI